MWLKWQNLEKKKLWEKKKMLVTSIFSFSYNVSKKFFTHGCLKFGIVWGKVEIQLVNPLPPSITFWRTKNTKLWKKLREKEKLFVTNNFSFSHSVFYSIWYLFYILDAL